MLIIVRGLIGHGGTNMGWDVWKWGKSRGENNRKQGKRKKIVGSEKGERESRREY